MVWTNFSSGVRWNFFFLDRSPNKHTYIHLLERILLKQGQQITGLNYVFQYDNASIHSVEDTKSGLKIIIFPHSIPHCDRFPNWSVKRKKFHGERFEYYRVQ